MDKNTLAMAHFGKPYAKLPSYFKTSINAKLKGTLPKYKTTKKIKKR